MIERFSDHAANERTFLAWIRTGIAVIAFGFVVEKFHIVLTRFGISADAASQYDPKQIGIALVVLGLLTIFGSIVRFVQTRARISSPEPVAYSITFAVGVGAALFLFGCVVFWSVLGW